MTVDDVLTSSGQYPDRRIKWPVTQVMLADAHVLSVRATQLLTSYASTRKPDEPEPRVTSGYRPTEINTKVKGAAKGSNHLLCRAADISDPHADLATWCLGNLDLLEHFELWMESPKHTPGWVHLQICPPRSNNRVFVP